MEASTPKTELELPAHLVLYDGVCGLCNKTVKRLVKIDKDGVLHYAPLQGDTAAALRKRFDNIPETLDSFVFVEDDKAYLRSRAFVRLARRLRYPWKAASWLWIIPWPLTDLFYRFIARIRYRVWGKSDTCEIPAPEVRARFLN